MAYKKPWCHVKLQKKNIDREVWKYLSNSYISMGFSGRAPSFDVSFTVMPETTSLTLKKEHRTRIKIKNADKEEKILTWDMW